MNNSYKIILFADTAQKNPATSNSTIKDIEVAGSKWLPGARDRGLRILAKEEEDSSRGVNCEIVFGNHCASFLFVGL